MYVPMPCRLALLGAAFIACPLAGCGSELFPQERLSLSALVEDDSTFHETDPNDLLELAEFVEMDGDRRPIYGRITGPDDVDVYDIGPADAGDRILVRMTAAAGLDPALALFDDSDALLLVNDHRNLYLGEREPFINLVLKRPSSALYLAVSATPGYDAIGDYGLVVSRSGPNDMPAARPDRVLLVFDGGRNVRIASRPAIDVPAFDAARIDETYAGKSEEIIAAVVAAVREDFAGLDVTIYSTSEGAVDDGGMTRVYFGTFDAALLGVAEGVDEFNLNAAQNAVVFTDTFAAFALLRPTSSEMAQAIANVASHEIGHLLGLVHTADAAGIMDVTASLRDLLTDQSFRKSPIFRDVFPVGFQDALGLLLDSLGGDPGFVNQRRAEQAVLKAAPLKPSGPPCRHTLILGSCDLEGL